MKVLLKKKRSSQAKPTFLSSCMQANARFVLGAKPESLVLKHTYTLVMKKVHEQVAKLS